MKQSALNFEARELPAVRIAAAMAHGVSKKILFCPGGGLGDLVCAEPTIRYCIDTFKDLEFSLYCKTPEIYRHLRFKSIHMEAPPENQFLPLYLYPHGLANQFINANLMHGVDFASVSAIRGQLPIHYRSPFVMAAPIEDHSLADLLKSKKCLALHVGKTWESRTMTTEWYGRVIEWARIHGWHVILVGKSCVDIPLLVKSGCSDYTDRTSLNDYIWLVKNVAALITNDSSALHLAACSKKPKIAFVPTCRPPWLLMHHRLGEFGGRMKGFYREPMWEHFTYLPNDTSEALMSKVPHGTTIDQFLPEPELIFNWLEEA